MRKEKNKKSSVEEMNLSNKEKEILDSYNDELQEFEMENKEQVLLTDLYNKEETTEEEEVIEEYEMVEEEPVEEETIEEEQPKKKEKKKKEKKVKEKKIREKKPKNPINRKMNIIFAIITILIIMVASDIILVTKYEIGPFFAIPLHKYDDGGTTEYYGLGYKVIKYHQVQGRRDKELGTWALKYNIEPVYADAVDLAIEFNNDETKSYKKYYKKFMRVTGTLVNVSKKQNSITISYFDEDGSKYDLDIVCDMETEKEMLNSLSTDLEVSAIGTMTNYSYKTKKTPATIYLSNCFAEQ